ncbi:MAG: YraN family protein [Alphaproteobacteria bacterium]|nr:YraN family protein [Alphaproteobacteria bacterium]
MHTKYKGILGEIIAAIYLIFKGFWIIERRFKTRCGEIDIIAIKNDIVVFVEVKSRKNIDQCFNAIRYRQLRRIQNASQIFLKRNPNLMKHQIRFDVVLISDWCLPLHIENVSQF